MQNITKILCMVIVVSVVCGVLYRKMTIEPKETQFAVIVPDIKLPTGVETLAFTAKGKDRYLWGRVTLPSEKLGAFLHDNAFNARIRKFTVDGSPSLSAIQLPPKMNSGLKDRWIEKDFVPTGEASNIIEHIVVGERKWPDGSYSLFYIFRSP